MAGKDACHNEKNDSKEKNPFSNFHHFQETSLFLTHFSRSFISQGEPIISPILVHYDQAVGNSSNKICSGLEITENSSQ
jgi:hypothetical protein